MMKSNYEIFLFIVKIKKNLQLVLFISNKLWDYEGDNSLSTPSIVCLRKKVA